MTSVTDIKRLRDWDDDTRESKRARNSSFEFKSFFIDQLESKKNPKALVAFLERLVAQPAPVAFASPELYSRFLRLLQKTNFSDDRELYKKSLFLFRKTLGLPNEAFDQDVMLQAKDQTTVSCSKELLQNSFPYFMTMFNSGLKEAKAHEGKYYVPLQLSKEALECLKKYIYTERISAENVEVLHELLGFAHMMDDSSFQGNISEVMINYLLDEKNESAFDEKFMEGSSKEFTRRYLERNRIPEKRLENDSYAIALSSFLSLFQKKDSKLLKFLANEIDQIWIDAKYFAPLHLLPKQYRKAIRKIDTEEKNTLINFEDLKELLSLFPNARLEISPSLEKELQEASTIDANDAFAHAHLGSLFTQKGQLDKAEKELRRAIELDPKYTFAHGTLGDILRRKNQLDEAERELRRAIELDPKYPFAHGSLGDVLRKKGQLDEAERELRRAIELNPKYTFAHSVLGDVLRRKGQLDEAERELRRAIEPDPKNAFAHGLLGEVLRLKGQPDEAEKELRRAIELDPTNSFTHRALGDILRVKGQLDEAKRKLRLAIELNPKNAFAHASLGDILRVKGQLDEAKRKLRLAIELNPKNAFAHASLGDVLRLKGQLVEAEIELRRAIGLDPKYAFAHGSLGDVLKLKGQLVEAEWGLRRTIELDPKYAFAHGSLGDVLMQKGQLDEAEKELRQAIELDPKYAVAYSRLDDVLKQKSQLKK